MVKMCKSIVFYHKHFLYYTGLEILVFSNLYTGRIYTALFMTSILFVLLLFEKRLASKRRLLIFLVIEVAKLAGLPDKIITRAKSL